MSEVVTDKDREYEALEAAAAPGAEQPNADRVNNRTLRPTGETFKQFMTTGWDDQEPEIEPLESSKYIQARIDALGAQFPGERIVIPAGTPNTAELFVAPRADNSTEEYYTSAQYGEYWVGPRAGLKELAAMTGLETHDIAQLADAIGKDVGAEAGAVRVRVIRETDAAITELVEGVREANGFADPDSNTAADDKLHEVAAEARMIKDAYEVGEMRKAVAATKKGFDRILKTLPHVIDKERSERMLEGAFNSVSREEGNEVGYDTIIASGPHAPILHWMRNTGVEAAQVGATYSDIHHACMRVLAERLHDWGILPVSVEESLSPEGQQHRRWHACGCAHHLGLDVHDCAQARYESYQGAEIRPGMIFTIEPGLYFKENDLLVPPEFRGIGVRIEDDVLMTEHGPEWISVDIPKTVEGVEAWMAEMAE